MNIKIFGIFSLCFLIGCKSKISKKSNWSKQPNIILIMADDLGYGDLGCYGNENIKTPQLDQLAKKGIRFLDFHSNGAVCSPTRAALMTGLYQQRTGIEGVVTARGHRHTGLATEAYTIADFFKAQQYQTGIVGKWHLGYDTLFSPVNNGFDFFKGFVSGNIDYHSHIDQEGYYDWWLQKDSLVETGYSTDLITTSAISFIKKNEQRPFFLYVAHESPHYPYQGRLDKADRTLGGKFQVLGSRTDRENAYQEMIEVMDEGIGQLVNYLKNQDLLSNTLILFCSDNGAAKVGSNAPLKGSKSSLWEGGHRVPAIAYWKDHIGTKEVKEVLMSIDIFPTLVDLVNPNLELLSYSDGSSFLPLLLEDSAQPAKGTPSDLANFSTRPMFWRFKKHKSVRKGKWKFLQIEDEKYLFDLQVDLAETNNLIGVQGDIAANLEQLLNQWEAEMDEYELRSK